MIIYGKNSVIELLKTSPGDINEILVLKSIKDKEINEISQSRGIKITALDKKTLDRVCDNQNHQGFAAKVEPFRYSTINEIIEFSRRKGERLFLLILDHIEDPQNFGAIVRTADFMGVDGIVIPKDRACEVNPTVVKVSSGASGNIKIAKETNLNQLIENLKKKDVWILGADGTSKVRLGSQDISGLDIAVVIGNEGRGLSQKIREKCDFLLSIPRSGKVDSLNASVAAGIFLYEIGKNIKKTPAN